MQYSCSCKLIHIVLPPGLGTQMLYPVRIQLWLLVPWTRGCAMCEIALINTVSRIMHTRTHPSPIKDSIWKLLSGLNFLACRQSCFPIQQWFSKTWNDIYQEMNKIHYYPTAGNIKHRSHYCTSRHYFGTCPWQHSGPLILPLSPWASALQKMINALLSLEQLIINLSKRHVLVCSLCGNIAFAQWRNKRRILNFIYFMMMES